MTRKLALVLLGASLAVAVAFASEASPKTGPNDGASASANSGTTPTTMPPSALFDSLGTDPDVVYLIANSSVIFGADPHGRGEEITFTGPVTVPKWPMKGYGRRVLPDGRQQIDIELTQSELTGESYMLHGPVVLGEHPDLRSLGTITERPRSNNGSAKNVSAGPAEEVPADFVVERKVLLTTAKGILYNETAVPVRGRIDSIPPIKLQGTATGVNVFRGMELPVALLDKDGNVNGWFYSKAHMAYAVKPVAIERSFIKGTVELKSGDKTEMVEVSGPSEIHYLAAPHSSDNTPMEVMVLALRGKSELLGGDIMFTETFSDRDHFSRGQLNWDGNTNNASSKFDLFVDLYTPSAKLTTHDPLPVAGQIVDCKQKGELEKGRLHLPLLSGSGHFTTEGARVLYNEAEKPVVQVVKMDLKLGEAL